MTTTNAENGGYEKKGTSKSPKSEKENSLSLLNLIINRLARSLRTHTESLHSHILEARGSSSSTTSFPSIVFEPILLLQVCDARRYVTAGGNQSRRLHSRPLGRILLPNQDIAETHPCPTLLQKRDWRGSWFFFIFRYLSTSCFPRLIDDVTRQCFKVSGVACYRGIKETSYKNPVKLGWLLGNNLFSILAAKFFFSFLFCF